MDVSSSTASAGIQLEVQKKAQDVQSQQVLKVLESVSEQSQATTAQKTGIGGHLNLVG